LLILCSRGSALDLASAMLRIRKPNKLPKKTYRPLLSCRTGILSLSPLKAFFRLCQNRGNRLGSVGYMAWLVEQKLHDNRYTIERELGRGQFGITYLASDKNKKPLVIKTLSDGLLSQLGKRQIDRIQETFLQEAVKLAKCRHPHIVRIKEPFLEGEQVCIAMEYVAGVDLASHAQKTLPEQEALRYIQQIGEALKGLHEKGLVHREVKPANIMLRGGKPEAVLIDFGLARGFNHPLTTLNTDTADGFDSLELYHSGSQLGAYTDVYSLAATLYALLTGQEPPTAMDRNIGKAQLIPPKQINSQISDRVNQAILQGMALTAEERPQTMQTWLDVLGLQAAPSMPWHNWNPRTRLAVIGIVAGVLGAIAIWIALKPSSPSPQNPKPSAKPVSQLINPTTVIERQDHTPNG